MLELELDSAPNEHFALSSRVENILPAQSIEINQRVSELKRQGKDVTTLSLGEAFFELPSFAWGRLDREACNHYTDSRGLQALRDKIATFYGDRYGARVDPSAELLITAGSKLAIFIAMQAILDPGDEVLIFEPAWLSYPEQASLCGATTRSVPYDVEMDRVHEWFSERTRLVIINNPNNPAGRCYTRAELSAVLDRCHARGIYLLVDEAYSDFVVDASFESIASITRERSGVIVVNSLSKNMGISGWRIGYIISDPRFVSACLKLNQHLMTCAPSILQYFLADNFDSLIDCTIPQARNVAALRNRVHTVSNDLGLVSLPGGATFYLFISIDPYPGSSLDFALRLLNEHHIAVVPGSAYGTSTDRFIRVSVGVESEERIRAALKVIAELVERSNSVAKHAARAAALSSRALTA